MGNELAILEESMSKLERRLEYAENRFKSLVEKGYGPTTHNYHGGWTVGYWEGFASGVDAAISHLDNKVMELKGEINSVDNPYNQPSLTSNGTSI